MPENCCQCIHTVWDGRDDVCRFSGISALSIGRQSNCPLIEVPPHGRLIDADAVERNLVKMQMAQKGVVSHGIRKSRAVVRDMATVIPAEESNMDSFIHIFKEDDEKDGMDSFIRILKD